MQIKPLTPSTLVYKEECVYCFNTWVRGVSHIFHRIKTTESTSVSPATKGFAPEQ